MQEKKVLDYNSISTLWCAIYNNGEPFWQFNIDGSENKYADIDKASLRQFILYRNGKAVIVIHFDSAKKLIYRMRRAMDSHGNEETVYLAGWQEKRDGKNLQMIVFLFEDGHTEIVDRFYERHPWFYSVEFLPDERI